jgi:hypothetical protein
MGKRIKISGFKPSRIDGTERIFGVSMESIACPKQYSYVKYLPDVLNQGENPICVPCSISSYLNWKENLKDGSHKDNKINYFEIYNTKTTEGDGMTFKEAFSYLKHHGVSSKSGIMRIRGYALIRSLASLRTALLMNGPCFGALPVYNYSNQFWKRKNGDMLLGYHAISIVGYEKDGFIIRNSWGSSFANNGYTKISFEDANNFIEIWTVLE